MRTRQCLQRRSWGDGPYLVQKQPPLLTVSLKHRLTGKTPLLRRLSPSVFEIYQSDQRRRTFEESAKNRTEALDEVEASARTRNSTWTYKINLDDFRFEVIRDGADTTLYSRSANIVNDRFLDIA